VGPELRRVIEDAHADLFEAGFWQRISARLDAGELIEIRPYRRALELRGAGDR
jgi:isocitrate dehydrogenase kinase/phosphatase